MIVLRHRPLRVATLLIACPVSLIALGATPTTALPERSAAQGDVIEGHYIVVYEDSVRDVQTKTNRHERRLEFRTTLRYRHALRGFSGRLSPARWRSSAAIPRSTS